MQLDRSLSYVVWNCSTGRELQLVAWAADVETNNRQSGGRRCAVSLAPVIIDAIGTPHPVLPGYVIIGQVTPMVPDWRGCPCSIHSFIGVARSATAAFCRQVDALVLACEQPSARRCHLHPGQAVRVTSGPMMGVTGILDGTCRHETRVVVAVSMLGVGASVEVGAGEVEAIGEMVGTR